MPVASGVLLANISIPLALALAVVVEVSRRVSASRAVALGLAVSAKLLLWPLLVWTLATRRLRTTALGGRVGVVVTFAAWAAIGFDGLGGYLGSPPAALRHPVREQLLDRRHGLDARAERRWGTV